MSITTFGNVLAQLTNRDRARVILKKIQRRFFDEKGTLSASENLAWIEANVSDFSSLAETLDQSLWEEAVEFSKRLERHAGKVLNTIDLDLGGGGLYPFLYFVTRLSKPNNIVETGVGAGFSTYAFLTALVKNGNGMLYSSDFPYFRLSDPEQYIGVLVDGQLKDRWKLYIDGDEKNISKIIREIDCIDVFHYDSDKSYSSRKSTVQRIVRRMHDGGVLFMDDIQDNSFFHDFVVENGVEEFKIFAFERKFVGMLGDLRCV